MAGIRLHVVAPLVLVAVKKCARDPSPYVRKCAAYALCKLYDLLPEENTTLEEIVDVLLGDNFFICASDPYQTRALKLEILTTIATESSIPAILEEFQLLR
uniref:Clathrin/coatomer adaptor adaptin-like N-terminal domain-containing protein n=1 Tax=Aegilops tauschii subsp. strangulata TaxID=200361 RepID=A0A453GX25_AEGTS